MVLRNALPLLLALGLVEAATRGAFADPVRAAIFPFALDDTSLVGAVQGQNMEQPRLAMLDAKLPGMLMQNGRYTAVDTAPIAQDMRGKNFRTCNGCEVDLARQLGAQVSVIGWVQKVSTLILNINVVIRSVPDGRVVHAASVDIRGDTDESWARGLTYLVDNRLFAQAPAQ